MRKGFLQNWKSGAMCVAACSMLSLTATNAYADTAVKASPEVQSPAKDNVTVKGTVTDATGEPVIGASVKVVGSSTGVVTDLNGNFSLQTTAGTSIEVSYVGYLTQTIKASANGRNVSIVLQEDSQMLGEVVAIGYGAQTKKKDLSAAVGVINNVDELAVRPVSSTESLLQGQLAGVTVETVGGDPTSTPTVVIRGQGSQNGDNVLWVVDGVPGAPITSLNEVESIVVLKDAASAAIYGAQSGAGGVVLVTTKKAKNGETSVSYDGVFGVRNAMNLPTPLNAEQEIEMRKRSFAGAGATLPDGWDTTKNPWIATTRTNWMDEVFRSALYQRHTVALNTGTEKSANRVSLSYNNDQGILVGTFNKNLSVHYNGHYQINKWVKISEDLVWKNSTGRSTNTTSKESGAIISAIYMPSSATAYSEFTSTGFGGTTTEDPAYIAKYGSNYANIHDGINPLNTLLSKTIWDRTIDTWSTTSLEIANVVPGLKFTSRFTYNVASNMHKQFTPKRTEVGKPDGGTYLAKSTWRTDQWKTENTLTYDNTFGKHSVGALLSTTADHYAQRGFELDGNTFESEEEYLQYIAYAKNVTGTDYLTGPDANVSLIGRLAYSYDDRYFVTASWRRDYAGRLPKSNNHGDFPGVTAGWKISNESFFPKNDVVSFLKLRASWGRVGNLGSISYNYSSPSLNKDNETRGAIYGVENGVYYNTILRYSKALNNNLTWETSEQFDLGLDINMFRDRLAMQFDWFEKRTFNLIQTQSMNWTTSIGLDAMLVNMGEIRNRGLEFTATWNDKIGKDWKYYVTGNFSWLKNWVSDIGVKDSEGNSGVWTGGGSFGLIPYIYQDAEGQPLGSFYLVKCAGIFQSDEEAANYTKDGQRIQPNAQAGDLKFVDYNDDGKIDDKDRQYCGSATPKYTFSLSAGFTWKDLTVSAMLQGVAGAQCANVAKYVTLSDIDGNFNKDSRILDAWSENNTSSNIPRLSRVDNNKNFSTASDWYLENASYLRLKNFTVSYDITRYIRKWQHLADRSSRLSVFVSGENLFTITDYTGIDPECGGYDTMRYPVSRTFSFGVKLTY